MKKRVLSLLLALCLCFCMVPTVYADQVFADEYSDVEYPAAGDLNVQAQAGDGRIFVTWDPVADIGVEITSYYVYCYTGDFENLVMYEPLPDEYACEFTGLENGMTYEVGVVIEYETGHAIDCGTNATPFSSTPAWPFTDVDANHPNFEAINFVYSAGLMLGTGDGSTFAPDTELSRAMTARILHTLVGNPGANPSNFTDVSRNFWYTEAIDWASNYKIISGNGKGQFYPNDNVTREQLAVMLYQFARSTGFDVAGAEPADLAVYYDGQSVSSWAKTAVQWACTTGILVDDGYGNLFPTESATRAEVAEALLAFVMFYS